MSKCSNCSFENAPGSKFCENCGQPFERACPNCSNPVAPSAKFCRNCGFDLTAAPDTAQARLADLQKTTPAPIQQKILTQRQASEGERKLVTVLFTDIVGSTTLAEKFDPEDWREIVSGAHQRVTQAIFRYEGTIAQLLGDGVLAFFGAPLAHEDDPVRGLNAALDIITSIRDYARELASKKQVDNFQMRVGLNTGLVVVGNIGSDLHVEYLAVGDTVNLAARMQSAADPNTILISNNTARWAKHAFDLESKGEIEIKGKTNPVPVFRVLARKAIPEQARGIEGLTSPLIGREREFKLLQACLNDLWRRKGQVVSVIGEAGLGKSRLVAEIKTIAAERTVQWHEGRSLSYETTTPYAPFIDLFTKLFGLQAEESDAEKYAAVKAGIERMAGQGMNGMAPFIAMLLGIRFEGEDLQRVKYLEPPQLRERIFDAVAHFFQSISSKEPLILVFEDLHWADSISLDLITRLVTLTERAPVMILALFRPQTQEAYWRLHETCQRDYAHRYTVITLEPLDEASSRKLVANLLEIEDLPDQVRMLILKKAEGNPFFVEEVIRSLLDAQLVVRVNSHWRATREIDNIQLPDTLSGVISARLDRLDEHSKKAAQTASVIGREFQFNVLSDVFDGKDHLDTALTNLQRRELVREKSRAPLLLYLFKHALTQEAAYGSLLLSKRRELHKRVADCLEQVDPERVNEIARHYLQAQDPISALPYLVQAGERAAQAYSTPEAIEYFTQAVEIVKNVNDISLARRAFQGLGGALLLAMNVPSALEHFNAMIEFGKAQRDVSMQVSAHNKLGMIFGMYLGQLEPAEQHLRQAERLGHEHQDKAGLSELYTIRCAVCTLQADFTNATHYLGESVAVGRESNLAEPMAFGLAHTANTYTYMCRFDQAYEKAQEAIKLSEEIGNQRFIGEMYTFVLPYYHLHKGDLDRAHADAFKGVSIAERIGMATDQAVGLLLLGMIAYWRGEYENAMDSYQRALEISPMGQLPLDAVPLGAMSVVQLDFGESFRERVVELTQKALQALQNPMIAASGAPAWTDIGYSFLAMGKLDDAAEQFQKALNYPSFLGLLNKPHAFVGNALVAIQQNRLDDAIQGITDARSYAEEHAMPYFFPEIDLADARIALQQGNYKWALDRLARAESLASEMTMRTLALHARIGAAKSLAAQGRQEEAEAKRNAAHQAMNEIASPFKDANLRHAFVSSTTTKINTFSF